VQYNNAEEGDMASAFITRNPVKGDINPKSPDVLYIDPEDDRRAARASLMAECKALKDAGIKDGDIVYVTVAYSDGKSKPGNVRNNRRRVKYEMVGEENFEMVVLFSA
jgi:hypothetical protein